MATLTLTIFPKQINAHTHCGVNEESEKVYLVIASGTVRFVYYKPTYFMLVTEMHISSFSSTISFIRFYLFIFSSCHFCFFHGSNSCSILCIYAHTQNGSTLSLPCTPKFKYNEYKQTLHTQNENVCSAWQKENKQQKW